MSQLVTPANATGNSGGKPAKDDPPKALGAMGTAMAIGLIVLWVGGLWFLWVHIDDTETKWARNLVIFHSIEAAAFAAAGALLGVQAKRVQAAEKAEKEAKTETAREKVISQLGERLASAVLVEKNHVPLSLETSHPLWTDKAGMPRSVQLAQELLDTRRANS